MAVCCVWMGRRIRRFVNGRWERLFISFERSSGPSQRMFGLVSEHRWGLYDGRVGEGVWCGAEGDMGWMYACWWRLKFEEWGWEQVADDCAVSDGTEHQELKRLG